jgi:hypothetical protein
MVCAEVSLRLAYRCLTTLPGPCANLIFYFELSLRTQGSQLLANLIMGTPVSAELEDQNVLTAFPIISPSERPRRVKWFLHIRVGQIGESVQYARRRQRGH